MKKDAAILICFPLMVLREIHKLRYGIIGPARLLNEDRIIGNLVPAIKDSFIVEDNESIVLAVSYSDFKKFISELEIITFLTCTHTVCLAEDEIFNNKVVFLLFEEDGKEKLSINNRAIISVNDLQNILLQEFFKIYTRWDERNILKYEEYLEKLLNQSLYKALLSCLDESEDKEEKKKGQEL